MNHMKSLNLPWGFLFKVEKEPLEKSPHRQGDDSPSYSPEIASNYRKIVFSGSIGFTSSNPPTIHRKIGSHGLQSLSRTLGVSMSLMAVCVCE